MRKTLTLIFIFAVVAATVYGTNVYTDNVVIVFDGSGSMNARMGSGGAGITRIDAAKQALKQMLDVFPPDAHLGLLVFNRANQNWVYELGPRNDKALISAIDSITVGGLTPLGQYMKLGADRLLEAREAQYGYGTYRLLVVTDGEATDPRLLERYTPEILARGIIIDVIGVAMRSEHTLAGMAHSYRSADDPESLTRTLQEVFAEYEQTDESESPEQFFAELEGFPVEIAMPMLSALRTSGNHPIGESPQTVTDASGTITDTTESDVTESAQPQRVHPDSTGSQAQDSSAPDNSVWLIIIVVCAIALIFALSGKKV